MTAALEILLSLIVNIVCVDVTRAHCALLHRVRQGRPVRLKQLDRTRRVVVIHLRIPAPIITTLERLNMLLPKLTNRDVVLQISLHIHERALFDKILLRQENRIVNIRITEAPFLPL